jgi:hypothetical protein
MDSAVWGTQAVVDQRRREREADAADHRQVRRTVQATESGVRRARLSWRKRRLVQAATGAAATMQEPAQPERELVMADDPH